MPGLRCQTVFEWKTTNQLVHTERKYIMSEIITESPEMGFKTLSSMSKDGIGFRMIIPVDLPKGYSREKHFETVRPLLDETIKAFVERKHLSEKFIESWYHASFDDIENTTYVTVFAGAPASFIGGFRLIYRSGNTLAEVPLHSMDILFDPHERMEIGAFTVEKSLPVSTKKRVLAELGISTLYWYKNISCLKSFNMLICSDAAGTIVFRRWGFSPVRKYHDCLSKKDVLISGDIPDKLVVHRPNHDLYGKDMVWLELQLNSRADWSDWLYRASGYDFAHPLIQQRLAELNLSDFTL